MAEYLLAKSFSDGPEEANEYDEDLFAQHPVGQHMKSIEEAQEEFLNGSEYGIMPNGAQNLKLTVSADK